MDQLGIGMEVESEHEETYQWLQDFFKRFKKLPPKQDFFKRIAIDHLQEHPEYYSRLLKAKL